MKDHEEEDKMMKDDKEKDEVKDDMREDENDEDKDGGKRFCW